MAHQKDNSRKIPAPASAESRAPSEEGQNDTLPFPQETLDLATTIMHKRFALLDTGIPAIAALLESASLELANKFANEKDIPARYFVSPDPVDEEFCLNPASKAAMLASGEKIGTLPSIFYALLDVVSSRFSSSSDIAAIIAKDPALSAKLLRLINSPFYGLRHPVDNISRAVAIVGNGPLTMLTMGTVLISSFNKVPTSLLDMRSFWLHCIATSIFARVLASRNKMVNLEHFFITGLLHDIGRLLIFITPSSCALHLMMDSHRRLVPMHQIEKEVLGFSHEELASDFLESWNCPPIIIEGILNHHAPLDTRVTLQNAILPVANTLATAMGYGSSGSFLLPAVNEYALTLVGVTPETLPAIVAEAHQTIETMSAALLAHEGSDHPS